MESGLDLERELNDEQREAVLHEEGPLLVLAGAGSGKTRVLTYRFAHLVRRRGVSPSRILAVTFTNKAAGEMRERIEGLIGRLPYRLWVGTFHSIGARLLRETAHRTGLDRDFTIFDDDDQRRLIRSLCKDQGLDPTAERVGRILSAIRRRKSSSAGIGGGEGNGPRTPERMEFDRIAPLYEEGLRRMNALDFDDLLLRPVRLFHDHPEILQEYAYRFEHVLVDEYQDVNVIQNETVRLLHGAHHNVCAVGDDDQSIYRWRGADVRHILRFEESFPDARVVRLERNYRSRKPILDAASAVIGHNRGRRGKRLWTDREGGEMLERLEFRTERDEGLSLAREISRRIGDGRNRPADFALFYRTNAQSRSLEEGMRLHAVPYTIVGGTRFYERKEVKDLLAYLRVLVNERDDVSLGRVLNVPARGIGDVTRERLVAFAAGRGIPLRRALASAGEATDLSARARKILAGLDLLLARYAERSVAGGSPHGILRDLVQELRFVEALEEKEGERGSMRAENVEELVSAVAEYENRNPESTLVDFLAEVSLLTDIDTWEEGLDAVTLMTLHNSKGLEFLRVHIAGVEEGLLPHAFSMMSDDEIEEERRLFYVGLTRAKEKVTLSSVRSRMRFGEIAPCVPSRFFEEIPPELIEERLLGPDPARSFRPSLFPAATAAPREKQDPFPDYENESQEASVLVPGERIRHGVWGIGRVEGVEGSGEKTKITVRFDAGFTKKIMVRYASIRRL
ncbi:MAG: UvrD-helicase domain-containing protein [Candidatus Eisenbacteria bacterium]|nr:UvrD-helicase domain-containing protein [Candidatus Eisenbacteria bacterium]